MKWTREPGFSRDVEERMLVSAFRNSIDDKSPGREGSIDIAEEPLDQAASLRDGEGRPRFVEQEFASFLACGRLAGEFVKP